MRLKGYNGNSGIRTFFPLEIGPEAKRGLVMGPPSPPLPPNKSKIYNILLLVFNGDPKREGGTVEWRKIIPNPKTWNGGMAENHLKS